MSSLVEKLPSYIKHTNNALQTFHQIRPKEPLKFIFSMDVKSLNTASPNQDGLEAPKLFLANELFQNPLPTATLLC